MREAFALVSFSPLRGSVVQEQHQIPTNNARKPTGRYGDGQDDFMV
jgi:hypothetical protein